MKVSIKNYWKILLAALIYMVIILCLFYGSVLGQIAFNTVRNNNLQKKQIADNVKASVEFYKNRKNILNNFRNDVINKLSKLIYDTDSNSDETILEEYFEDAEIEDLVILDTNREALGIYGCEDYNFTEAHFTDSYYNSIFSDVDLNSANSINITSLKDYDKDAIFIKVKNGYWVFIFPEIEGENIDDDSYFWEMTLENVDVGDYSDIGVIDTSTDNLIYCWNDSLIGKKVELNSSQNNWGYIDNNLYYITKYDLEDITEEVVAITSINKILEMVKDQLISIAVLVFTAITLMIFLIVFLREDAIDANDEIRFLKKYFLKIQLRKYFITGLVVSVILAFSLMLVSELDYMTDVESDMNMHIEKTAKLFDDYYEDTIAIEQMVESKHFIYGEFVDTFIKHHPDYVTKKGLSKLSNILEVSNISIFDSKGKTISTSSPLDHLDILSDEDSPLYELRYVLTGKETAIADADTRIQPPNISIFAIPRRNDQGVATGILTIDNPRDKVERLEPTGLLRDSTGLTQFCVDEDGTILIFYDNNYVGKDISSLGITDEMLSDGFTGKYVYDNMNYAAEVKKSKAGYTVVINRYNAFSTDVIGNGILSSIMFITACAIFAYDGLGSKYRFSSRPAVQSQSANNNSTIKNWYSLDAGEKMMAVIRIYIYCFSAYFILAQWMISNGIGTHDTIDYIFNGDWKKTVNIFSIVCNVFTVMIFYSVIKWLEAILTKIAIMSKQSGETICRLIANIIKYVGVIICAYQIAINFGVDAKTALTSIGIAGFGLTFGAQDMIKDIIAGIFILFEGSYKVGDMLLINGSRFWVKSIGIRATKVEAWGQVRVINNSQMNSVVNVQNSQEFVDCEVYIGNEYNFDDIEAIFDYELPLLRPNYPEEVATPSFMGVADIDANGIKISVRTYAPPVLKGKLTRQLKKDMLRILDKYDIKVAHKSYEIIGSEELKKEKEERAQTLKERADKLRAENKKEDTK